MDDVTRHGALAPDRRTSPTGPVTANLEARMARSLVRSATRNRMRAYLIAIVALIWFALTSTGSYLGSHEPSVGGKIGDALYNSLTFLGPRDGYGGVGRYPRMPTLLWWGRFFGVALSMIAIFWAALYQSRRYLAGFLIQSRARGHIVVLSANGFADALARGSAEQGHCVVLVEEGVSSDRIVDLGRAGVVVMPADATLDQWLDNCRIADAARVISWIENDSLSLSSAFLARRQLRARGAEIAVRLDNAEMQRALRNAPELLQTDQGRLRPVSPTAAAVRAAFSDAQLIDAAMRRQAARVHVVLHGNATALGVVASTILRHYGSIHLAMPMVSWDIGADDSAWTAWRRHHYSFLEHGRVVFGDEDAPTITRVPDGAGADLDEVALHVVDHGADDRTIAAAFDLASMLAQRQARPPAVRAILRDAHASRELMVHASTLAFAPPILINAETSFDALLHGEAEAKAARLHRAYVDNRASNAASARDWGDLGETFVEASRASADHGAIKAFDVAAGVAAGLDRATLIDQLAQAEHRRWSVERLLDGWAPATERNNERRLHDKLRPWRDLSDADRDKDVAAVELMIGRLLTDG